MIASPREALDLLDKWFSEKTPVIALMTTPNLSVAVKITGFVNGSTSGILIISDDSREDKKAVALNYLVVPISSTESYFYVEAKDLKLSQEERDHLSKEMGQSGLSINFKDGLKLSIFERA